MKTLIYGAGPLGTLYAHRLFQAGRDVTILARGQRYDRIKADGLALVDEITGAREKSTPQVVDELRPEDQYDLVIVLIRKNKHDCDNYALAKDTATMRMMVRAAREGGRVLHALGYTKRQPFRFNLFYWLPEILNVKVVQGLLGSKFAEVAFARHARAARDEMRELADEFQSLAEQTSIATPNIELLRNYTD